MARAASTSCSTSCGKEKSCTRMRSRRGVASARAVRLEPARHPTTRPAAEPPAIARNVRLSTIEELRYQRNGGDRNPKTVSSHYHRAKGKAMRHALKLVVGMTVVLAGRDAAQVSSPSRSTDAARRAQSLLQRMTLEEKIGQLNLSAGVSL